MAKGMLWLDETVKLSVEENVTRALAHFAEKHKEERPYLVQANSGELEEETAVAGIKVVPSSYAPKHHLIVMYGEAA